LRAKLDAIFSLLLRENQRILIIEKGEQQKMNQLEFSGKNINVQVHNNLSLTVLRRDGRLLWESSKTHIPIMVANSTEPLPLGSASDVSVSPFNDGKYQGHTVRLSGFGGVDVTLEFQIAIDADVDELMI